MVGGSRNVLSFYEEEQYYEFSKSELELEVVPVLKGVEKDDDGKKENGKVFSFDSEEKKYPLLQYLERFANTMTS